MRTKTLGSLLGAAALAASFTVVAGGSASASTPRWSMTVTNLPPTVAEGSAMGYQVTISNAGPSNISQLFLVTKTPDAPVYVVTSQGSCSTSPSLGCTLGALNAKKSVTITVAYSGPVSGTDDPGDPVFQANSNGLTYSDGGTSHGDTLTDPNEKPTAFSTNPNFAGGFALGQNTISTDPNLGPNNVQSTALTPPASDIVATVQDGPDVNVKCGSCSKSFGEWSALNVANGATFSSPFDVTIQVLASLAPSNINKIQLYHVLDNGAVVNLKQCTTGQTSGCVTVTSDGTIVTMVAHLNQNGVVKGHS